MTPVTALAAVQCATATENILALETLSIDDLECWSSPVDGLPVSLIQDGSIAVPENPGLGYTGLNRPSARVPRSRQTRHLRAHPEVRSRSLTASPVELNTEFENVPLFSRLL